MAENHDLAHAMARLDALTDWERRPRNKMRVGLEPMQDLAEKLNAMAGPVRFLIPEGGVSAIDRPGQPFHDPEADRALFASLEERFRAGADRKLIRLPHHINDEVFIDALVAAWREVAARTPTTSLARSHHAPHR